jgi:hypothetical protein
MSRQLRLLASMSPPSTIGNTEVSKNSSNSAVPNPIPAVDRIGETTSECPPDPSLIAEIEASRTRIRKRLATLANRLAGPTMVAAVDGSDASDELDTNVRSLIEGD